MSHASRFARAGLFVAMAGTLIFSSAAIARITKFVVETKQSPAYSGQTFGDSGQYERLIGKATGELDPSDPHNSIITDINLAQRNAKGKVEYTTTFLIVKPVDMTRGSGLMWHDVPNRGGRLDIGGQTNGDVGLSSGWQGDNSGGTAPGANNDYVVVPIAVNADGSPITGKVMGRILNASGVNSQPMIVHSNPVPYKPVSMDTTQSLLTTHTAESIDGVVSGNKTVASTDWAWGKCSATTPFPGTADPTQICIKGGFDPALLYQVVFTAKDPYVLGVGFAAFRDLATFLKYETQDDSGTPNPLAGKIKWTITRGVSQSGNYLRAMMHLGFMEDESNRKVYEGAWPIIAGRRASLNMRFAMPDGVLKLYEPGSEGPQWWAPYPDTVRGLPTAGILDRCTARNNCPKIIETFGAAEVWGLKLTPEWVGTSGTADIPLPDSVRRYYISSTQHGGGSGGFSTVPAAAPSCPSTGYGVGTFAANPIPHTETTNAVRAMFRNWVMNGAPPPPSRYPTLAQGNLVESTKTAMGFPSIPGVPATAPTGLINPVLDYDFGNQFNYTDASGIQTVVPPIVKQAIKMMVPRVDADGNEIGGVPVVLREAPLGTYMGWNITNGGFHNGQICNYAGGMIPFPATMAQRLATGDPRMSIEERYGNHDGYVATVQAAASNAVAQGFLLPEDADKLIAQARTSNVLAPAGTVGVIEFNHPLTEQFFLTSNPTEATSLDGTGAGGGWGRTGESFRAWPNDATAPADTVPVCRLFGKPGVGPADHFYSSNAQECATYKADPAWIDEGFPFRVRQPGGGLCPAGQELVTRLSKAGNTAVGSRHRYIVDPALTAALIAEGWKVDVSAFCGSNP
jgi:Alpha/beta hydrolase domain